MKTKITAFAILLAALASCKKETPIAPAPIPDISRPETVVDGKQCFEWVQGKDTISMSLAMTGPNANGELAYKFFEKDKSFGTFSGAFIGDTLFADYSFRAEGSQSNREIVFLKKGDTMIQATGEMETRDGKEVFKNSKKLDYRSNITLAKTDCK